MDRVGYVRLRPRTAPFGCRGPYYTRRVKKAIGWRMAVGTVIGAVIGKCLMAEWLHQRKVKRITKLRAALVSRDNSRKADCGPDAGPCLELRPKNVGVGPDGGIVWS